MKKEGKKIRRFSRYSESLDLPFIQRFIFPSPRVSGEELDGLAATDLSPFDNLRKPSGN
jgi:hypothetical protein